MSLIVDESNKLKSQWSQNKKHLLLTKKVKFEISPFVSEKGLIEQLYHQLRADAQQKINIKNQQHDYHNYGISN